MGEYVMKRTTDTLQEAVNRLTKRMIVKGFQHEALHEYKNLEGATLHWRIRLKNPTTGDKWIRPLKWDDNEDYSLGEPEFTKKKPALLKIAWVATVNKCKTQGQSLVILANILGSNLAWICEKYLVKH
jgi:hypothetical protein